MTTQAPWHVRFNSLDKPLASFYYLGMTNRKPRFSDIPQLTDCGHYQVNVSWEGLEHQISNQAKDSRGGGLDLDPDFQRGYVWTPEQKSRYVEHILRGGTSGRDLYFNCVGWMGSFKGPYVIVDGKQRLDAVRGFLRDEVRAFGHLHSEFSDSLSYRCDFVWHVNNLETRAQVLQWYLEMNSGGTVHSQEELDRVRALAEEEAAKKKGGR